MRWEKFFSDAADSPPLVLIFGLGVLGGVMLIAFLPNMPWSSTIELGHAVARERLDDQAKILDLAAQRSMASAAWYMVVISSVAAIVGAASLLLIARTLVEAKRSADAAVDGAKQSAIAASAAILSAETAAKAVETQKAQVRGHLTIERAEFIPVKQGENDGQLLCRVGVGIRSAGGTPLRNVEVKLQLFVRRHPYPEPNHAEVLISRARTVLVGTLAPGAGETAQAYFIRGIDEKDLVELAEVHVSVSVSVQILVAYNDVFGDAHQEAALFHAPLNKSFVPNYIHGISEMQRVPIVT